ncbi:hypothetical protein [Streptomyces wedmorensis]|uniref:hypothetical protein n=1 Tax=Streptomyces wedmorensis TaxID=43759 RepID=UPI00069EF89A|nr:hypothetical protein [Streptomyces wedmorensis]
MDVLVALTRRTTERERRALTDALLAVSGRRAYEGPARPVGLSHSRGDQEGVSGLKLPGSFS